MSVRFFAQVEKQQSAKFVTQSTIIVFYINRYKQASITENPGTLLKKQMKPALFEKAISNLCKRKSSSLFRHIPGFPEHAYLDLSSNSYLALHQNSEVLKNAEKLVQSRYHGNLASRLVGQNTKLYEELEHELAQWKKCESSLVFNSGYAANTGIIASLCSRHSDIFSDRLNHASIIDGSILSGAKVHRYKHNDMDDLRNQLKKCNGKEKLIVTDTVFSMDGDRAKLSDICQLASDYSSMVMVDEAHATGIFGQTASGLVEESGTSDGIHIRVSTLSKAVAGLGGFFAGDSVLRDFFINNARSFVFSTGLPHSVLAFNLASVRHIRENPGSGKKLLNIADKFRQTLSGHGFYTLNSTTQIVPVITGTPEKALSLSNYLKDHGVFAPAVRAPTVPTGTERVRLSLNLGMEKESLSEITRLMCEWKNNHG
ncbi:8-amino-7-oxononanoate synthase [Chitinispirillum alkaliphilum]|nr:8-amino-7-oxononanoate synthase [Chitinispirillum alkaliphilum]